MQKKVKLSRIYKDLMRAKIIENPSLMPQDKKWYDIYISSVHSEDFWIRLERVIRALKEDTDYFLLIQPVLLSGQTLTLGESTIVNKNIDMEMLKPYYRNIIRELEEKYQDTFVGSTRLYFRNLGKDAIVVPGRRTFSTTSPTSNVGLDTLQNNLNTMSTNLLNMSTKLETSLNNLPASIASSLKGVIPQASSTSEVTKSVTTVPSTSSVSQNATLNTNIWVDRELWNTLPANVRRYLIAYRNGQSYDGDLSQIWVDSSIWEKLNVPVRSALIQARKSGGSTFGKSSGKSTYSSTRKDADLQKYLDPIYAALKIPSPFVSEKAESAPTLSMEAKLLQKLVDKLCPEERVETTEVIPEKSEIVSGGTIIEPVNTELENRIADLEKRVDEIEKRLNTIDNRLSSIDSNLNKLTDNLKTLTGTVGKFATSLDSITSELVSIKQKISPIDIESLERDNRIRATLVNMDRKAFTAKIKANKESIEECMALVEMKTNAVARHFRYVREDLALTNYYVESLQLLQGMYVKRNDLPFIYKDIETFLSKLFISHKADIYRQVETIIQEKVGKIPMQIRAINSERSYKEIEMKKVFNNLEENKKDINDLAKILLYYRGLYYDLPENETYKQLEEELYESDKTTKEVKAGLIPGSLHHEVNSLIIIKKLINKNQLDYIIKNHKLEVIELINNLKKDNQSFNLKDLFYQFKGWSESLFSTVFLGLLALFYTFFFLFGFYLFCKWVNEFPVIYHIGNYRLSYYLMEYLPYFLSLSSESNTLIDDLIIKDIMDDFPRGTYPDGSHSLFYYMVYPFSKVFEFIHILGNYRVPFKEDQLPYLEGYERILITEPSTEGVYYFSEYSHSQLQHFWNNYDLEKDGPVESLFVQKRMDPRDYKELLERGFKPYGFDRPHSSEIQSENESNNKTPLNIENKNSFFGLQYKYISNYESTPIYKRSINDFGFFDVKDIRGKYYECFKDRDYNISIEDISTEDFNQAIKVLNYNDVLKANTVYNIPYGKLVVKYGSESFMRMPTQTDDTTNIFIFVDGFNMQGNLVLLGEGMFVKEWNATFDVGMQNIFRFINRRAIGIPFYQPIGKSGL